MKILTHEDYSSHAAVTGGSDRSLGIVLAVFLALLGLFPLLRGRPVRIWFLGAAGVFLFVGLVWPALLHPLNRVMVRLAMLISKVTNPVITGLLFYLLFTPLAFLFRLLGKDLLHLKDEPGATSYWIERHPPGPAPETMRNQF